MIKALTLHILFLISTNSYSQTISQFNGSLFIMNPNGEPSFLNSECASCNPLSGEIDNDLSTFINTSTGVANDIIGTHDLLATDMNWSIENLSFISSQDNIISISGTFLWTNSVGLTTSTFTQLSELQPISGSLIALDGDADLLKGNTLIDGPFQGHSLYLEGTISPIPIPGSIWLMASGLFILLRLGK